MIVTQQRHDINSQNEVEEIQAHNMFGGCANVQCKKPLKMNFKCPYSRSKFSESAFCMQA